MLGPFFPPVCEELKSSKHCRFMAISDYPEELGKVTLSFWVFISSIAEWEHYMKGGFQSPVGLRKAATLWRHLQWAELASADIPCFQSQEGRTFFYKTIPVIPAKGKPHKVGVGSRGRPLGTFKSAARAPVPSVKPALRFLFCTMMVYRLHSSSGISGLPRAAEVWGGVAPPSWYKIRQQRVQTGCLCSNKEQDEKGQLPSQLPRIHGFTVASLTAQPHWKGKSS